MMPFIRKQLHIFVVLIATVVTIPAIVDGAEGKDLFSNLFGFTSVRYDSLDDLPEWIRVLNRHPKEDFINEPQLSQWHQFIKTAKHNKSLKQQVKEVNLFANKFDYILDIDNYGLDDYWAIIREFLKNSGDCEDFAITKFFSLRQLGFSADSLRVVVLQDTNLGIAHAVVAVALEGDILILDNQVKAVLSHKDILHYTPLFSVNEKRWWLHIPNYKSNRG